MGEAIRSESASEESGAIFQPDTVLPTQFYAALREKGVVEGEKRLMAAVLADAVECYMKQCGATDHRGMQLFRDAEEWLFGSGSRWLYAYGNICDVLGLEPEYVRQGLLQWRARRARPITLRKAAG
jgi:hypothetical protein